MLFWTKNWGLNPILTCNPRVILSSQFWLKWWNVYTYNIDIHFFCGKINFILIMGSWWTLPVLVFVIFLKCVKTLAWKIRPGTQMIAYFCYIKILRLILIAIPGRHHRIYIVFFLERLSSSFFFWYITKLGTPA